VAASALFLALSSAVLHAAWNLLLGRANDVQAAAAVTFVLSVAIVVPFALVWWQADASVWPYALASSLLEAVYVLGLAYAYRVADVSLIYPSTRGIAPVLALVASVAILGHRPSAAEVAGVLVVSAGVVLVRDGGRHTDGRAFLLASTIAASIAAYTLVDRVGIQRAGALTYFVLVLAAPTLLLVPLNGWTAMRAELGAATGAAALANVGSFLLGLLALRRGAAAPVLAVRSSSIVIATLLAGRLLSENVSRLRLAGAALVFAGVVLLAV
jgi:drug/metabolite transporter (DMT)-like permease